MSEKERYFQRIRAAGVDEASVHAVSEFITLGELDKSANTPSERDAWEALWHEFLLSSLWPKARAVITRYGV